MNYVIFIKNVYTYIRFLYNNLQNLNIILKLYLLYLFTITSI